MEALIKVLKEKKLTLSLCESFTGGLMASGLCKYPGVSSVFLGSIVAYSKQAKVDVVKVDPDLIERYGMISPLVVKDMAEKTRTLFHSDFCLAFSGNAGPEALEGKPVGLWFGAIASEHKTIIFNGISNLSRNALRSAAIEKGVKILMDEFRNNEEWHINR